MQEKQTLRNEGACKSTMVEPRGFFEWIDYYQKNKPQTNALAAGLMVILFGGNQLGWGIFNNHLQSQSWATGYEDDGTVFWAIISWFIAAIVGFFVGAVAVNKMSKMTIYMITSLLSGVSALLCVISPESIYYVFPAQILGGLSYGIVHPTILIHACEVSVPKLRGMIVASIHLCLMIGVFTTSSSLMPVYRTRNYEVDPTRTMGINGLICIVTGIIIAIFLNRESPVYLIKRYREQEALNIMMRLRSESHETTDIRHDFNELKLMVMEDSKSSLNIFNRGFFVVLLMKLIFVISFNLPLNIIWLSACEKVFYNGTNDTSGMWLSGLRWVTITIMMFLIDINRIKFYLVSTGICSVILFSMAYLLNPLFDYDENNLVIVLGFAFQIFSGLALGIVSNIYSTEVFNTKTKPLAIAAISSLEFLLQIFLVVSFFYYDHQLTDLMYYSAVIAAFGLLVFKVPDTSRLSLRNARNKFTS